MGDKEKVWDAVRESYGRVAENDCGCCCGGPAQESAADVYSRGIGYSDEELKSAPPGSNLGAGCGNPIAIASIQPGEVVLDLGSGGGFDAFLAAKRVGPDGRIIGVDMTKEMVVKARKSAAIFGYKNVEFRFGKIEEIPVEDDTVDLIISNCVINLSPDKDAVFREAYRVLKPGGRLAVSDVVALKPLPYQVRQDEQLICSCVGGAATVEELESILRSAGFERIKIEVKAEESREFIKAWAPGSGAEDLVASAVIEAVKAS